MHWAVTLVVIASGFLTVRPLGLSGRGLAVAALLVLCSAALLVRQLPEARFLYFRVGHIGYRFPLKWSLPLVASSSLLCAVVLHFHFGPGHHQLAWGLGLTTGLPVVAGILSRSKQRALEAVIVAAESSERAARAEARTAALTERSRIARDVHDVPAHSLAGIISPATPGTAGAARSRTSGVMARVGHSPLPTCVGGRQG